MIVKRFVFFFVSFGLSIVTRLVAAGIVHRLQQQYPDRFSKQPFDYFNVVCCFLDKRDVVVVVVLAI